MENTNKELDEKFISLETKLAYLEDFLNQLQEVSVEHTKTIELLKKENKLLLNKIQEMAENLEGDIPNRRPPHY
jgi:SlyX protein